MSRRCRYLLVAFCAGVTGCSSGGSSFRPDGSGDGDSPIRDFAPDASLGMEVVGEADTASDPSIVDAPTGVAEVDNDSPLDESSGVADLGWVDAQPDLPQIDASMGADVGPTVLDGGYDTTDEVAAASRRPNILVILVDDLGYGDLSSYGAPDVRSPAVDKLAKDGMRFTDFHPNSPVCSPTRAALLTGRYPDLVGVPGVIRQWQDNSWGNLSDDATLLAQPLREAGYHTAIIGKWHLGFEPPDTPLDRGFELFHGFLADMMEDYYTHLRGGVNWMRLGRDEVNPVGHATDVFTEWAIDYLAERKGKPEPFFLYLAYNAPHDPIQPPPEWLRRVLDREPGITPLRAALVALVEHLDDGISRVMQALEDNGQREDTLVIFASDNGGLVDLGSSNGPLRGQKGQMWEGGVRVPAVVSWPGHIQGGTTTPAVFATMDIFPTVLDAAGIRYPGELDGRSFLPVLLGKATTAPPRPLFFVRREAPGGVYYGGRNGDFKLVQNTADGPFTLYDLANDLAETTDLTASNPAAFSALTSALEQHRQLADRVPWQ
jgi:arylsulfatase A-like enzyme